MGIWGLERGEDGLSYTKLIRHEDALLKPTCWIYI